MPERQQMQQSGKPDSSFQKQAALTSQNSVSHPASIIQRARINPKSLTAADFLQLQRTIGNRAVGRLLLEIRNTSKVQQVPIQRQEVPEEEEPLQGKFIETIQRQEIPKEEEPLQGKFERKSEKATCPSCMQRQEIPEEEPLQKKSENNTGMPDNLKAGVESLSGIDMSDVRVHYNSDKPAKVGALAYTQGTSIHVAPGQERHLSHEAWHVVQQAQGRVRATTQLKGLAVNDEEGLEREADEMGGVLLHKAIEGKLQNTIESNTKRILKKDKTIQLTRWRGVLSTSGKKWQTLSGKRQTKDVTSGDENNWSTGCVWDDVTGEVFTKEEWLDKLMKQKRLAAQKRESSRQRDAAVNAMRRIPPRRLAVLEDAKIEGQELEERRKISGKPILHRGDSFVGNPNMRRKEQSATYDEFMEQVADPGKNTLSDIAKDELKQLFNTYINVSIITYIPSVGRPKRVISRLELPSLSIGQKDPPEPEGQTRLIEDDRGHLVTESLVDDLRRDLTNCSRNIIAENKEINQGYKRGLEMAAEAILANRKQVLYVGDIFYADETATRPSSVRHSYIIGGDIVVTVEFANPV